MGLDRHRDGSHDWEPISIIGTSWQTPIWQANRRGNFMLTQEHKAHPWLFEDAGLRLEDAAALAYQAVDLFDQAVAVEEGRLDEDLENARESSGRSPVSCRGDVFFLQRSHHKMQNGAV